MATVPTVETPEVAPSGAPNVRQNIDVSPGAFGGIQAAQNEALGGSVLRAGDELARISYYQQNIANRGRIDDAKAQALGAQTDLAYGNPNDPSVPAGFRTLHGQGALGTMPDGTDIDSYYTGLYRKKIEGIGATLTPYQRNLFTTEMAPHIATFRNAVVEHRVQENQNFNLGSQSDLIDGSKANAVTNYGNDAAIADAANTAAGAATRIVQLTGKGSASDASAKVASNIHLSTIEAALSDGNTERALALFQAHNHAPAGPLDTTGMTAADLLTAGGKIKVINAGQQAITATQTALTQFAPQFAPTDFDRLKGVVRGIESNGRDTNPDGTPLASPKGAKYAMQVMPATAANPGFGIAPAAADTPAEYNRVGEAYLGAMVQKYGNIGPALAAYNAGPGAVDAAMKTAQAAKTPDAWLSFLPKETQAYVQKGSALYGAGEGAPAVPAKADFVTAALNALPPGASPQTQDITRQHAEHQYASLLDGRKQTLDKAVTDVQQALLANGGDFTALDPTLRMRVNSLDPKAVPELQKYAENIANPPQKTNMAAYNAAVTYPSELAKMSDVQFEQFQRANFAPAQQKEMADLRASILTGKISAGVESLNTPALNTVLQARLADLGIDAKPKPTDTKGNARVGAIQQFVRDDIYQQQQQIGRKMLPEEIEKRVNTLFAKNVDLPGLLYGTNNANLLSMKAGDIPSTDRDALKSRFTAAGVANPTDTQMLNAYWKTKNAR